MICPKCEYKKTKVLESRSVEEGQFRKRKCLKCNYEFFTEEYEADGPDGIRAYWASMKRKERIK